jgi:Ca2+-binding EF-hand superfamily protein
MRRPFFLSSLGAGLALAAGLAWGDQLSDLRQQRFTERDANRDGYLSLAEYGGHAGNFRALDDNGDSRLSRNEFVFRNGAGNEGQVTTGGRDPDELEGFELMDRNDDGIVSRGEWVGDTTLFNRLDRTDDGRITRDEFLSPLAPDSPEGRLQAKDRNNDGVLSRSEWLQEPLAFNRADRNRDGRVTVDEYRNQPGFDERRFAGLDLDRDGVIVRREWPRDDGRTFDETDRDHDGAVTRREFLDDAATNDDYAVERTTQFQELDANGDGYLSTREWTVERDAFDWLDDNRDARLSRAEFRDRARLWDRLRRLDRDGDGVVSRSEWQGSTQSFRLFDRNRDGVLRRTELVG